MIKNMLIYIVVGIAVIAAIWLLVKKNNGAPAGLYDQNPGPGTPLASPVASASPTVLPSGLQIQEIVIGQGKEAKAGDTLAVHYTGWLTNGQKFDSSVDRGQPFTFRLGAGEVISGWDQGVAGMKIGGKRKLIIPPALAYGSQGAGGVIPPNATLLFEVELLAIQ